MHSSVRPRITSQNLTPELSRAGLVSGSGASERAASPGIGAAWAVRVRAASVRVALGQSRGGANPW
eukprot:648072-Alexandrium_andersonii.AAC.1